ncbi:MAG TPA: PTS glucose transporter subunit IIA [Campylobacterales bacterium]|jgi:PTS system glucose-specific IIA component|nr:PTS glucose transporter subunit IIA [Campylobacterales bacterium]HHD81272.1 PTS glucose transporter subunit IIA [Campylobacterales bacterium]HHH51952.1 PTS glucose transporter subunit IIA [Campylobacterales bacterium]
MFGLFKKSKKIEIFSPLTGEVLDIENVPDEVFSQKLVGDGIAIIPSSSVVVSPIKGVISRIFPTKHAFSIKGNNIEIMIHIGLDTVSLQGEGFEALAKEGDKVEIGTPIIRIDKDYLISQGKNIITPIIVSSQKDITIKKSNSTTIKEGALLLEVVS